MGDIGGGLYRRMCVEVDYAPILRTAVEDCGIASYDQAIVALDGFLQWFALIPVLEEMDGPYVMLKGDVDQMFHAFILNTAFYRDFCHRYVGKFVDHFPSPDSPREAWIERTVELLAGHYGSRLNDEFQRWRDAGEEWGPTSSEAPRTAQEGHVQSHGF